jgi:hypothetical protein
MNFKTCRFLFFAIAMASVGNGSEIAFFIDGTASTGANLAAPVEGITVSNLTSVGISFGTVTSISRTISGVTETVTTPAGPTAGSSAGSRWLKALNTEVADGSPVSTDEYFKFTLTADSGNLPQLGALSFDMVTASANSNGAIDTTYQLFVAADEGGFSAIGDRGTALNPNSVDLFPGNQFSSIGAIITANIDLTGLPPANSYEFRIALGDNSGAGTKTTWIQGISVTPPSSPGGSLKLVITANTTPGLYDFEWDSQDGKVYDLLSSTDLSTPISSWPLYDDGTILYQNLPATGNSTTLTGVPSGDTRRFFAIREEDPTPAP